MASKKTLTSAFEALPKLLKIILVFFLGALLGGIYRIVRFTEKGNVITLVVGLLGLFTGIGNLVLWIADLVSEVLLDKITFFA